MNRSANLSKNDEKNRFFLWYKTTFQFDEGLRNISLLHTGMRFARKTTTKDDIFSLIVLYVFKAQENDAI